MVVSQDQSSASVNLKEIENFSHLADTWWDENGAMKMLHRINPIRLDFIRNEICDHFSLPTSQRLALKDLNILDIGCGAGLLCEPLAHMGAQITGIDASEKVIQAAQSHAQAHPCPPTYFHTTAENLYEKKEKFDVVCAMEVIEHVDNVPDFLNTCSQLVKPHGLLILSTINRTAASFLLAKVGAEYILNWIPKGTHEWSKFLQPSEIILPLEEKGLTCRHLMGMVFNPIKQQWSLSPSRLDVNYLLSLKNT